MPTSSRSRSRAAHDDPQVSSQGGGSLCPSTNTTELSAAIVSTSSRSRSRVAHDDPQVSSQGGRIAVPTRQHDRVERRDRADLLAVTESSRTRRPAKLFAGRTERFAHTPTQQIRAPRSCWRPRDHGVKPHATIRRPLRREDGSLHPRVNTRDSSAASVLASLGHSVEPHATTRRTFRTEDGSVRPRTGTADSSAAIAKESSRSRSRAAHDDPRSARAMRSDRTRCRASSSLRHAIGPFSTASGFLPLPHGACHGTSHADGSMHAVTFPVDSRRAGPRLPGDLAHGARVPRLRPSTSGGRLPGTADPQDLKSPGSASTLSTALPARGTATPSPSRSA